MSIRVRSVLLTAALVAICSLGLGAQSTVPAKRLVASRITGHFKPAVQLGARRPLLVMLTMAGDPVAVARGNAPGRQLAGGQADQIERTLRAAQDALAPAIRARGATVVGMFQHAINGIKVRATPDQIDALAALPGVVAVKPVVLHHKSNAVSVPFIGAPLVWQGTPGLHGEHIRIAIVDSGIDYTHANFGGPGTVAAFNAAKAASALPANPTMFGPAAPKVKGGIDLVGDGYDPSQTDPAHAPKVDPNPLDCDGHGSHVAGTAAGFGVTSAGARFTGPYDGSTPSQAFRIGPGVAPLADLYAVRVLSCAGSGQTDVVLDAIEWSVKNGMQVINMSLGTAFGAEDSAESEAAEHAVEAGIVVVSSSGNDGRSPYIQGAPASGDKVISVAAMDAGASFPGAVLALSNGAAITAQNSNVAAFVDATTLPVLVLRNPDGSVSFGCTASEYAKASGKLVVTMRGECDRVVRATLAAAQGARAAAMINNEDGYPPFDGEIPNLTIPFFGVRGEPSFDGGALAASTSATLVSHTTIANPTFGTQATFSSAGPRNGDGRLKPDISAPGVGIASTGMGTGNQSITESGTSMSAPHVAGVAALAIQAHPGWSAHDIATAIVNTANASQILDWSARLSGAGVVQARPATRTSVIARGGKEAPSLSFGVEEFSNDFQKDGDIDLENLGTKTAKFFVSVKPSAGTSPHSIKLEPLAVSVPAGHRTKLHVKLTVPAATAGDSTEFRDVAGLITLTPATSTDNGGAALGVPYYLVPRARSGVETDIPGDFGPRHPSAVAKIRNESLAVPGTADFYSWGLSGKKKKVGSVNLRAVGVQTLDVFGEKILFFAVNTFTPWSSAATSEFDILIDVNGDNQADFAVVAIDLGFFSTGAFTGEFASVLVDLSTGIASSRFMAVAPTDGNTLLIPVVASDMGLTSAGPRFAYTAQSLDLRTGLSDFTPDIATFNAWDNSISTGAFAALPPKGKSLVPIFLNPVEWKATPSLGVMVVAIDNGTQEAHGQAQLLKINDPGKGPKDPKHPNQPGRDSELGED